MAYCRWGCDGSDVYVFADVSGGVTCCGCDLDDSDGANFATNAEMAEHLLKHREAGHTVPEYVFERLKEDEDNTREEGS